MNTRPDPNFAQHSNALDGHHLTAGAACAPQHNTR